MKIAFHKDAKGRFYDQDGNPLSAEQVQDFTATAYAGIGNVFSGEGLKSEADGWYVGVDDKDPDKFHWFFAYKTTPFGRKFFAIGHDGSTAGKVEMMKYMKEAMQDQPLHPWIEASGAVQKLMENWHIPKVPTEIAKMLLPGKPLEPVDEYSYRRSVGGNPFVKTVYGYPKVPHQASWKSTLLEPVQGKGFARITALDNRAALQAEWAEEFGDHSGCPVCGTGCEMLFVGGVSSSTSTPAQAVELQKEWNEQFGDHSECPVCGTACENLFVSGK